MAHRTLIISDLHLGSPMFKRGREVLELMSRKWDRIIVNGDLFELMGYKTAEEIRTEFQSILHVVDYGPVTYVNGNHDNGNGTTDLTRTTLQDGGTVLVMHGHQFDTCGFPWLVKLNWIIYNITRIDVRAFLNRFVSYKKMNERAEASRVKYGAEYVVLGHSHRPGVFGRVINSGDMIENNTYVVIEGQQITIHRLGDGQ